MDTDDRTLFVGNLHSNVNEELLYELFLQAGPIERVHIPVAQGKVVRYGFVTYIHKCTIDYALELYKGTRLFETELSVKRRGERNSDNHTTNFDRYGGKILNKSDLAETPSLLSQEFTPPCFLQLNSNINPNALNNPNNFVQNSLKGHWSDRSRPYDHQQRQHYSSRSSNNRDRTRNHSHDNSSYNKSYRDRDRRRRY